jgi:hypothetical protein
MKVDQFDYQVINLEILEDMFNIPEIKLVYSEPLTLSMQ